MARMQDPEHRIRGNHDFGRLPSMRHAVVVAVLIAVFFVFATTIQQSGLWPDGWNATFDGTTE